MPPSAVKKSLHISSSVTWAVSEVKAGLWFECVIACVNMPGSSMASERAFFAHRLGYRDVGCEKANRLRDPEIDQDGEDEIFPSENRRQYRLTKHNDVRRRGCDITSSARVQPTIPPLNQNSHPASSSSHTPSTSCSSSASLLRAHKADTQASLADQQPWDPLTSTGPTHPAPIEAAATILSQYSTSSPQKLIDSFNKHLGNLNLEDTEASRLRASCRCQSIFDVTMKADD